MRFEFVVRSGKEVGRTVAVNTGQTISLGRLKGCDVVVDDEAASRRHCTITAREDVCVVSDLQSANGTFVNEKRIASAELHRTDKIRIGSTVIELIDAAAQASAVRIPETTTSLSIVEARSQTIVQRAVDPTKLEFLSQVYKRKDEAGLLQSAQKYLTTLHKVSEILARAASVEALFDSIVSAILEVSGGDRAAILMRPRDAAGNEIDMVVVRTKDGKASGEVKLSRTLQAIVSNASTRDEPRGLEPLLTSAKRYREAFAGLLSGEAAPREPSEIADALRRRLIPARDELIEGLDALAARRLGQVEALRSSAHARRTASLNMMLVLGAPGLAATALLVWLVVGFAAMLPALWRDGDITGLGWRVLLIGLLGGIANGLGSWALFEALERGAKASVAVPLTALYPLVTIVLARIFLAETLTIRQWAGIALAVAGGAMLSYETEERSAVEKQVS